MLVFLDFEASSLGKDGYPIEVAWVFEDGQSEGHLIGPAPDWNSWDDASEAVHGLSRALLEAEGEPYDAVARRMVEVLSGHDLLASAPSWDGKWLSRLLRAASFGRHRLRLRDSDDVHREAAASILAAAVPSDRVGPLVAEALALGEPRTCGTPPAHRALADAREERNRLFAVDRRGKGTPVAG